MKSKLLTFAVVFLGAMFALAVATPLLVTQLAGFIPFEPPVGAAYATVLGLLFIILVVEIVAIFKIDDSTFHTAILAGCLFMLYAFSADMEMFLHNSGLNIPQYALGITSELAFVLAELCCCWYIAFLYDIPVSGRAAATVAVPAMAALLGYTLAVIFDLGYIFHFVLVAIFSVVFLMLLYRAERRAKIGLTTYLIVSVYALAVGAQSVNALYYGGPCVAVPGLTLAYSVLTLISFVVVYFAFSVRTDLRAVHSDEYKSQAESFRTRALTGQIKPHFIFNSLEAVRALYHKDIASGDAAVGLLSDFLRGSINSFDSELVPFETEIDNVFSYTEFENLKRTDKIEVIFDIDCTDFSVPPFSIQPFVENAIRYSGVDSIENGRIVISSYRENGCAVVEISDNGKGFDPSAVPESSHGIRNACGRFSLALGAVPQIKSEIGKGTNIKIVIGTANREEQDEDHRD